MTIFSTTTPNVSEMSTVSDKMDSGSDTTLIVIIVILVIAVIGLIAFMLIRKYQRRMTAAKTKLMEEGHPQISLPTLGTHYELNSLLSLNTIGRKSSRQSEFSVALSENSYNVAAEKTEHLLDRRVSKYIDNVDSENNDLTLETIVNTTIESEPVVEDRKRIAPKADPELFESLDLNHLYR